MSDKPIPRRVFLKKAGAAGTAAATGLAASPPLDAQTVTARPAARSADLILSNAKVITVDHDFTIAQAIAIARTAFARPVGPPNRAQSELKRPSEWRSVRQCAPRK
jgi:hypothetical protein